MKKTDKPKEDKTLKTTPSTSTEKNLPISAMDELEQALLDDPNLCLDYETSLCTS